MNRIAVIEDQTAVRDMIVQILRLQPGYEVVIESGTGHEGMEQCLHLKPDVVIIDVMLPGLNGAEVLRRLSQQLPRCRFLVFSGYQDPALLRDLLEAGAHGFIGKTSPLSELQSGIRAVVEGGTYFSAEIGDILRQTMHKPKEAAIPAVDRLTAREREVLQLIAESHSTRRIAEILSISAKTAENHRTNLMKKLDLHDIASLTRFAIEYGIIAPPQRPQTR
jgi:DNA-binding NarL/FixJ family response regulator